MVTTGAWRPTLRTLSRKRGRQATVAGAVRMITKVVGRWRIRRKGSSGIIASGQVCATAATANLKRIPGKKGRPWMVGLPLITRIIICA